MQKLNPASLPNLCHFNLWALENLEDPLFLTKILFSNEALSWLNEYVNKQNHQTWNEDQPKEFLELPLHPEKKN